MAKLIDVPGIGSQSAKLLRAAKITDVAGLAGSAAEALASDLADVNEKKRVAKRAPSATVVEKWIAAAKKLTGEPQGSDDVETADESAVYDYSEDADVLAMVADAPLAIPVPAEKLRDSGVTPSMVLEPILLTAIAEDVQIRVAQQEVAARRRRRQENAKLRQIQSVKASSIGAAATVTGPSGKVADFDMSRVKPMQDFMSEEALQKLQSNEMSDEDRERVRKHKLLTATLPETNAGVDKESRRYIKGVLHPLPTRVFLGSLVTILFMLWVPLSIAMALMMMILETMNVATFSRWWLLIPAFIPILGGIYLFFANTCRCRICGQKQFLPKNCLKNRNAHHIPVIGYIFPTAVQIALYKWFRCIFCGTPVRIKE